MSIYEIGRVCVKIAGRDAGRKCVVVEAVDDKFVTVDGNVRRKKVNIKHLEPLADVLEIKDSRKFTLDISKATEDEKRKIKEEIISFLKMISKHCCPVKVLTMIDNH